MLRTSCPQHSQKILLPKLVYLLVLSEEMCRKEIYEAKYPESKAGVKRAIGMHKVLGHNVADIVSATFTEDTASKIGVSPRTIRRDVQERDI